tara:strand:+ start:653 stop:2197 length:1545 start_codon:yes stop_codon:yes gene_type:complete
MSNQVYDLAIVGAGTAGLEIAKNASRSGLKVCLIEQGSSEGNSYFNKVPLLSGKLLQNDNHCLSFTSTKQQSLGNRELPILQGTGFGGSSLINGNVSYLGFEKKFEEIFNFWPKNMFQRVSKHIYHNTNFSYNRQFGYSDELTNFFCKALNKIAVPEVSDLDNFIEGWAKIHLNIQGSKRYNFSNDFKENAEHKNIEKLANTRVIKIFFKDNYAKGVECENLVTKGKITVNAKKIILSAGTIFSPLILMRSGIGSPSDVYKAGIPLKIQQDNVGKHLKDHANFRIQFDCLGFDTLNQKTRGLKLLNELVKYIFSKNSIFKSPGATLAWNKSSFNKKANINNLVRYHLVHFTQERSLLSSKGIKFQKDQRASLGCFQVFPKSEGSISLDNKNRIQIDPNYLSNKYDRALTYKAFLSAIDLLREAGLAKNGKDFVIDNIERNIGSETFSGYHLIGTNRMSKNKNSGVVDEHFKVFGINNLYVCDASIFPDFVSTHQYLPTLAASKIFCLKQGFLNN